MPVRSKMPPTLISCAKASAGRSSHAANASPSLCIRDMPCLLVVGRGSSPPRVHLLSVRERIQPPVRLNEPPASRQPVGLEHEKEDDDEAEQPRPERREQPDESGEPRRELAGDEAQELGEERDEGGPEDRSLDAAEPADDDHPELVDGE